MVTKKNLSELENRIYNYYRDSKEIEKLQYKLVILKENKEKIVRDIKETNISITPELFGPCLYTEKIQTSFNTSSYAENAVMKEISILEKELRHTIKQIIKTSTKIRDLKNKNSDIKFIIDSLKDESKIITELKYKYNKSLEQIGMEIHLSKSTISRKKTSIINNIYNTLYLQ